MKYEMIFGDEKMFAGVRDGIVALRFVNGSGGKLLHCKEGQIDDLVEADFINHPIVAMRRIIKEPKRWTWEDKKAGRLPEVDWIVRATSINEDARVAAINNDYYCVVFEDGGFITLHVSGIAPIETPTEKAQGEEDAFVDVIVSEYNKMPSSISFKAGIRAAYRKLKGGE